MRLAIVSTPRCGNTWLRHLLSKVFAVPTLAVANPYEPDWLQLPEECIVQIHWHRIPSFEAKLAEHGFRVAVLARHPLDVLISILHFSLHDPTARWLEGEDGNERSIYGAMPRSAAFREYATGRRAVTLLNITPEWWQVPECLAIRYEDLARNPRVEVERVAGWLGIRPQLSIDEAIAATTIPQLRAQTQNEHHFWIGRPGLWRSLLTAAEIAPLAKFHRRLNELLEYGCEPDSALTDVQADANWIQLVWADLAERLHVLRTTRKERDELRTQLEAMRSDLQTKHTELDASKRACRDLATRNDADAANFRRYETSAEHRIDLLESQLAQFDDLGPLGLHAARRLRRLSQRFPHVASKVKPLVRGGMKLIE